MKQWERVFCTNMITCVTKRRYNVKNTNYKKNTLKQKYNLSKYFVLLFIYLKKSE